MIIPLSPGLHGGNTREHAQRLGIAESDLLDFSANINPLGMPASLKKAICQSLEIAERYPDPHYQELHQILADYHHCPLWQIIAGNGATELIFAAVSIIQPKKTLLLTPSFAEYRRALKYHQSEIVEYQLDEANNFQVDKKLLAAITSDIDCLFICSPNNPTGQLVEPTLLAEIIERCRQRSVSLIIDEAFLDFAGDQYSAIPGLANNPHVFVLRSLTKFFAIPGLRLGYLLNADPSVMQRLREQQQPWTINAFAELAGKTILNDELFINASHQWLQKEQPHLFNALSQFAELKIYPPTANYIFLRCLTPELELQSQLLQHHILIRSCANYPGLSQGYYRVAVKDRQANDRLIGALKKVFSSQTP